MRTNVGTETGNGCRLMTTMLFAHPGNRAGSGLASIELHAALFAALDRGDVARVRGCFVECPWLWIADERGTPTTRNGARGVDEFVEAWLSRAARAAPTRFVASTVVCDEPSCCVVTIEFVRPALAAPCFRATSVLCKRHADGRLGIALLHVSPAGREGP